jgi:hypothetical protein
MQWSAIGDELGHPDPHNESWAGILGLALPDYSSPIRVRVRILLARIIDLHV